MIQGNADRVAQILASLEERDILGADYPEAAITLEERRRWNPARLLALALRLGAFLRLAE